MDLNPNRIIAGAVPGPGAQQTGRDAPITVISFAPAGVPQQAGGATYATPYPPGLVQHHPLPSVPVNLLPPSYLPVSPSPLPYLPANPPPPPTSYLPANRLTSSCTPTGPYPVAVGVPQPTTAGTFQNHKAVTSIPEPTQKAVFAKPAGKVLSKLKPASPATPQQDVGTRAISAPSRPQRSLSSKTARTIVTTTATAGSTSTSDSTPRAVQFIRDYRRPGPLQLATLPAESREREQALFPQAAGGEQR